MKPISGAADSEEAGIHGISGAGIFAVSARKSPLRVLVADDEALIRWSVTQALSDLGAEVEQADSAAATVAAMTEAAQPFDVVVLDLRLPDMDDLSLVATLRRDHAGSAVVLMTAFGTPAIVALAYGLGVHAVLAKPFDLNDLAAAVFAASRA